MNSLNARTEQPFVDSFLGCSEADINDDDRVAGTDQAAWSATGVVRLGLDLRIMGINPVGAHLIRHVPELIERDGRLHVRPRELDGRFQDLLATIAKTARNQSAAFAVPRRDQVCPLTLVLLPATDAGPTLLMSAPETAPNLPAHWLQAWFGLTQAESRIAAELAAGCTLETAADTAGIRVSTVRTHLHRIFSKTGTSRQSELVKLLLSTPAGVAMHSNFS